jgi:hypothetical protein
VTRPRRGTPLPTDSTERPRGGAPAGIKEESGEVASHTGISDEQDFGAVSARETIESDKERIERNRADYVVVQPKDLPVRPGDTGPNIVEFALATTHAPGVQMYKRSGMSIRGADAACAKFPSPDQAQQDFLAKGGPDRDRMGVDPDGRFACRDPRPGRAAVSLSHPSPNFMSGGRAGSTLSSCITRRCRPAPRRWSGCVTRWPRYRRIT